MSKEQKLEMLVQALVDRDYMDYDFNNQESGYFHHDPGNHAQYSTHFYSGDKFEFGASPSSCRECSSGKVFVEIPTVFNGEGFQRIMINLLDRLCNIGSYPNFEHYQNYDCSGTYLVTILADGQWKIDQEPGNWDFEKVRRRVRDALNKCSNPEIVLQCAGHLNVKVF